MKKALVLLSTYNGHSYLKEQLDSILYQEGVILECLIRDDGSDERTISILNEYVANHKNIKVVYGENIGWKNSFFELLYHDNLNQYDIYAFSDQDDIWLKDKLKRAILHLQETPVPQLYYSSATLVNENLEVLVEDFGSRPVYDKTMVLTQNFSQGCTMVFNYQAYKLITSYRPPYSFSHDIWIPILCTYFGKVVYDNKSSILYRQHNSNVASGIKSTLRNQLKSRINQLKTEDNYYYYSKALLEGYDTMLNLDDKNKLEMIIQSNYSYLNKIFLFFDVNFRRSTIKGTLCLKIALFFTEFTS